MITPELSLSGTRELVRFHNLYWQLCNKDIITLPWTPPDLAKHQPACYISFENIISAASIWPILMVTIKSPTHLSCFCINGDPFRNAVSWPWIKTIISPPQTLAKLFQEERREFLYLHMSLHLLLASLAESTHKSNIYLCTSTWHSWCGQTR